MEINATPSWHLTLVDFFWLKNRERRGVAAEMYACIIWVEFQQECLSYRYNETEKRLPNICSLRAPKPNNNFEYHSMTNYLRLRHSLIQYPRSAERCGRGIRGFSVAPFVLAALHVMKSWTSLQKVDEGGLWGSTFRAASNEWHIWRWLHCLCFILWLLYIYFFIRT